VIEANRRENGKNEESGETHHYIYNPLLASDRTASSSFGVRAAVRSVVSAEWETTDGSRPPLNSHLNRSQSVHECLSE
jgi:hypothetical protein